VIRLISIAAGRLRCSRNISAAAATYRVRPTRANQPSPAPSGAASLSGVRPGTRDATPHAARNTNRPVRSHLLLLSTARAARSLSGSADANANTAATVSPTGWARSNPAVRAPRRICGVARPCRRKKPALPMNTIDTSSRRASARRADAPLMSVPSPTFTPATPTISQKWLGLCCHMMLAAGWASSSHSPSRGTARWIAHTTARTGCVAGGRDGREAAATRSGPSAAGSYDDTMALHRTVRPGHVTSLAGRSRLSTPPPPQSR
jgi:hypothetical protein